MRHRAGCICDILVARLIRPSGFGSRCRLSGIGRGWAIHFPSARGKLQTSPREWPDAPIRSGAWRSRQSSFFFIYFLSYSYLIILLNDDLSEIKGNFDWATLETASYLVSDIKALGKGGKKITGTLVNKTSRFNTWDYMTYSKNSDGGLDIKMDTNKYIRWPSDVVGYITKEKLETAGFIDESEGGGFSLDNVLFKRTSSSDGNKWTTDKAYSSLFVITFSGSGGNNAQSAANYGLL